MTLLSFLRRERPAAAGCVGLLHDSPDGPGWPPRLAPVTLVALCSLISLYGALSVPHAISCLMLPHVALVPCLRLTHVMLHFMLLASCFFFFFFFFLSLLKARLLPRASHRSGFRIKGWNDMFRVRLRNGARARASVQSPR